MRLVKVLAIVAVVGAVALASAPEVWAQCGTGPRFFASIGGGGAAPKSRVDANAADDAGNEVGRMWASSDSDLGNNWGYTDPTSGLLVLSPQDDPRDPEGRCPSDNSNGDGSFAWWTVSQATYRGFDGAVAVAACETSTCPGADQTFLIEDESADGTTAYYVAARTNYDPGGTVGGRNWDLNKPIGNGSDNLVPIREFPWVETTASAKNGTDTDLTLNIGRPNGGGAAIDMGDGTYPNPGLQDTDIIVSIVLYEHTGPSDPGRERRADCGGGDSSCWGTPTATIPYNNAAISGVVHTVDCGDTSEDVWVAAGFVFEGGANDVSSLKVGKALLVQCDPQIADPDTPIRPGARSRSLERRDDTGRRGR